jgi:hypothetical protein
MAIYKRTEQRFHPETEGKVVPETRFFIDGESYFMENSKAGEFQFKIAKRISDVVFHGR